MRPLLALLMLASCLSSLLAADPATYTIKTDLGVIVIALDTESAPKTCEAFTTYVRDRVYRDSAFDYVDANVIQGGKPGAKARGYSSNGNFSYTKAPAGEFTLGHKRGAVLMARTVGSCNPTKTTNSTQFCIYLQDAPKNEGEYSVFGHVTEGMDVVDAIAAKLRANPATPVEIDVKKARG